MAAPLFPVNTHRHDPYRTFKFQLLIDGKPVAGLKKMGALKKKTEAIKWRASGDPSSERVMPGGTSYEPIVLEQGRTHDPVFANWAALVNNVQGDAAMSLKNFRKDIVLNVLNLQGQVAISYKIYRAWVSEYQALPDLESTTMNAVAIESITIQIEGFEQDGSAPEPTET